MNWLQISKNPVDTRVNLFLTKQLRQKKALPSEDFLGLIKDFVSGKSVLDIGVVEHDFSHIHSDNWKHKKIKGWSKEVLGVDILEEEVNFLNKNGYDVRLVDATSSDYLGVKFERVVIGDVVEHVNDPVKLLEFAGRHIDNDGLIMVSTPNPFYWRFFLRTIREGTLIANADHVSWITPTNALEIARRSNLTLEKYYPMMGPPKSILKRVFKKISKLLISEDSEVYASAYIYIFKKY